jgi:hypothetical protein
MSAYDEIVYQGKRYQTKSLVCWADSYEVRGDELWHQDYDTEDQSDPSAAGIERLFGMCAAVNHRWVRDLFTGTVYTWEGPALAFDQGKLVAVREWSDEVAREMDIYG